MTRDEAASLLRTLRAYYSKRLDEDAEEAWLSELRSLDFVLASKAVRSLIVGCKFWPSFAELFEAYGVARRQAEQRFRDAERRAAEEELAAIERPPLREIPDAVEPEAREHVQRWLLPFMRELPEVESGACDECGATGARYAYGEVALCAKCARRRKVVKALLDGEAA